MEVGCKKNNEAFGALGIRWECLDVQDSGSITSNIAVENLRFLSIISLDYIFCPRKCYYRNRVSN